MALNGEGLVVSGKVFVARGCGKTLNGKNATKWSRGVFELQASRGTRLDLPLFPGAECAGLLSNVPPGRFQNDRAAENCFQQMAFGGDGLGGSSQGRIAFGGDYQCFAPFVSHLTIFNLKAANVAIVGGI